MIPTVPELPEDVRELKARVAAFLESEVYPLEERVAEAGRIDPEWAHELRRKSWAEGFGMLNMPEEAGGRGLSMLGQVALEEESGKATNGLGFAVVDRGPAELWDIATPEQRETRSQLLWTAAMQPCAAVGFHAIPHPESGQPHYIETFALPVLPDDQDAPMQLMAVVSRLPGKGQTQTGGLRTTVPLENAGVTRHFIDIGAGLPPVLGMA